MNRRAKRKTQEFPSFITGLPEADVQFKGVQAWISQSDNHQVIFFDISTSGEVAEHYHETPQWGVVVEGQMELTMDGETKVYRKGEDISSQPELDTQQGLEARVEQLTSATGIDTSQKTSRKTN